MARWTDIETEHPEFAARVRARFEVRKHCTLATLRRDGAPRISGIEVDFADGDVAIGMMDQSRKAADLARDPRLALHSPTEDPPETDPSAWPGEAKISGVARPATDRLGPDQPTDDRLTVDISEVVFTKVGSPADHLVIETWHPGRGLERHTRV